MRPDHRVVVNLDGQYSVWPADREPPAGWRDAGMTGSRQDCLDHVTTVWTDLRPRHAKTDPVVTVPELVAGAVARNPDAVAVECGPNSLTFGELSARAGQLASRLSDAGVGPGATVAVLLERSVDLVVALLGVWRCGASFVPLDPVLPAMRIAEMADDAVAKVAITSRAHVDRVAGMTVVDVAAPTPREEYPEAVPVDPDAVAYTVFTSGSTGRPKGVEVTHRGLANYIAWAVAELASAGSGGAPVFSSVAFDLVVPNIWAPLAAGQRVWLYAGELDELGAALAEAGPFSFLKQTPGHLEIIGSQLPDAAIAGLASRVVVAGEELPGSLVRRWRRLLGDGAVLNSYGPTEATVGTCTFPVNTDFETVVPIGRPLPNVVMRILDGELSPVRAGAVGELYVGGAGVARGYVGRPDLTADRFVPDPHGEPGARLYRTGDLARWRADGAAEFAGRVDDQVKINGYRVEPGEVRAVLLRHPRVADAAVVAGDGRLVAYVVGTADGLADWLRQSVPEYLVPSAFLPVDAIPLTANGKVDRRALPNPGAAGYVAPRTDVEREVAEVWAEVLGTGQVGRDTDFTALGGNSLHATRVLARLRARHGAAVSLRELFAAGTVGELASLLDRPRSGAGLPSVRPVPGAPPMPSLSQRRLWFLDHLSHSAGVAYNVPAVSRVRGRLDLPALRAAVADVVRGHEQLRTSFHLVDGSLVARVEDVAPEVRHVNLADHPKPEREALRQAERLAAEHVDLGAAPLLRCAVYRIGEDDHLLALVVHHLVADGWTLDVIDRHLAAAYRARVTAEPAEPAAGGLAYRDFAHWQHDLDASPASAELLEHWRTRLDGAPTVLDLPADHPRPAVSDYRGRRVGPYAMPGLLAAVRELAGRTRTTTYAVCAAALGVLLRELTGRRDLLVASPTVGRPDPALEDVVGFFANTVLVRLQPDAGTFRDLVLRAHETALDAIEHQYLPFERLAAELAPAGDLSRSPLAQVALAYQGQRRPHAELAGLVVEPVAVDNGTVKFDLTIELHEAGDELAVTVEYRTDLFSPERAAGVLARFVDLLADAVGRPDTPLADLVVAPERAGRCLHELFAETAARRPDQIAVADDTRRLTYAELDRAANRLAHRLRRAGAGPEQLVGLCAKRTVDLVIGVLAVLKAGAGYLPLDPRHPTARLTDTLTDAGSRVVLGDEELCAPLAGDGRTLVRLDDPAAGDSDEPPQTGVRPENVAYVIYTSGSTGKPKGVVVTHANVTRLFTATEDHFGFGPADVWTLFHSIAFDFSVWELWGALLYGGRLVVVPHLTSRDPARFLDLLRAERVTVLNQTPTAFRQLAAAAADTGYPSLDLRVVVFGGEALDPAALRDWVGGYGAVRPRLFNMYGITETTVHVTCRRLGIADLTGSSTPIGRPIADLRVHVLDENLAEVPPGVEGEMHIGGAGVARGYLNRPELTAQRFVRDPFGGPGDRLYRSGDLAVRRPDGELEFRGRRDSQVKLHGFRIELGEIERALTDQPGVRAAACVLREDAPGQPRLVAYLVPPAGAATRSAEIRAALLEQLPEHMVPAAFVELSALPLSTNGKLDRAQLPAPSGEDSVRSGSGVRPRTETEQALAEVWSAVLGIDEPDVHDNFFTVGGDSIIAIRLGAAARAAGLPVTIERIFLHPTIAELAAECDRAPTAAGEQTVAVLSTTLADLDPARLPAGVADAYPTAAMQLGILFECDLADDAAEIYHDLISVRLAARFDRPALERALATVCARHEILRTSFDMGRFREPVQFVHRAAEVPLAVEDAPAGEASAEQALRDWWVRDKAYPFDIGRPPLVRCHVLVRSATEFQLSLSVHHAAFDGWSLAQLATDLLLAYDGELRGGATLPPLPPARYREFVVAEQAAVADPDTERFWAEFASSPEPPAFPVLPGGDSAVEHAFRAELPGDLDAALRHVAADLGLPLKSVFLAAHARALRQLTDHPDVVTGLQVHGRLEQAGADQILGLFLNIVPVRLTAGEATWAELATAAFAAERTVQPHRRYPLARIQRAAGLGRTLFEVVFNYTDFHVFDLLDRMTEVRPVDWWLSDRHSFPLMVEISREPHAGTRVVKTSTSVDSPLAGTAVRLGELVLGGLEAIAADPHGQAT